MSRGGPPPPAGSTSTATQICTGGHRHQTSQSRAPVESARKVKMANTPSLISGALIALGTASLLLFAVVAVYTLNDLRRQARYIALLVGLGVIAVALTRIGALTLALCCSIVVLAQSASYTYFALRTAFRRRLPASTWSRALPRVAV